VASPLLSGLRTQYVRFYWDFIVIVSAIVNSVFVLLFAQNFRTDPTFLIFFFGTTLIMPLALSIAGTLYLSEIGEKRVVRVSVITLFSTVLLILTEYWTTRSPVGLLTLMAGYVLASGYILDLVSIPILGVSGARSDCIHLLLVSDSDVSRMKTVLNRPDVLEALEVLKLKPVANFHVLRTTERMGFNWFAFLLPHPVDASRSVLILIGYTRSQFEIRGDRQARNRLNRNSVYLQALLTNEVGLDESHSLEEFIQLYPLFVYEAEKAFRYALRRTDIPLSRIHLSNTAKAILITVTATVLVSVTLLAEGQITEGVAVFSLLPEVILVGVELLPHIPRRRRRE